MFVTKKYHDKCIKGLEQLAENRAVYIIKLERELEEAKNLKELLGKFTGALFSEGNIRYSARGTLHYTLPDTVLQYCDDILGGKVIKQEGTKCLVIDKEGSVTTGLTKQKADKGYRYKLIRE